jgi:hypothetical protein
MTDSDGFKTTKNLIEKEIRKSLTKIPADLFEEINESKFSDENSI